MTTGTELQERSQALKAAYAAATQRLTGAQQSLQRKGVGATFLRVSRRDHVGDMGIIGNLLISNILTGLVLDSIDLHGLENHLDDPLLIGAIDAYNIEDEARNNKDSKRTKVDGYPEGRRKGAVKDSRKKKAARAFAAANSKRFSPEVEAELASMYDLLDMVGAMQQQGVRAERPHNPRPAVQQLAV